MGGAGFNISGMVSSTSFPGHTQLHADWEWPENEATMYHKFRYEDFRNSYINAGQPGFGNRYFRNRYRLEENTLVLTFDPYRARNH